MTSVHHVWRCILCFQSYHVTYGDTIDELQEKVGENQIISFVRLNLEYEIAKVKQALKNKTVVLPVWLDILAQ